LGQVVPEALPENETAEYHTMCGIVDSTKPSENIPEIIQKVKIER